MEKEAKQNIDLKRNLFKIDVRAQKDEEKVFMRTACMNLVLALTDQGISSNMILGFDKAITNDVLEIDKRFRPEILITVGYSDEKVEPSYRLPVDHIIEKR
ncbi:hypothetical protein B5770_10235 [Streptococcus agalactiae]|nr:hypothetical protein B5770_10235 [Streptococcus agalactiae]